MYYTITIFPNHVATAQPKPAVIHDKNCSILEYSLHVPANVIFIVRTGIAIEQLLLVICGELLFEEVGLQTTIWGGRRREG